MRRPLRAAAAVGPSARRATRRHRHSGGRRICAGSCPDRTSSPSSRNLVTPPEGTGFDPVPPTACNHRGSVSPWKFSRRKLAMEVEPQNSRGITGSTGHEMDFEANCCLSVRL